MSSQMWTYSQKEGGSPMSPALQVPSDKTAEATAFWAHELSRPSCMVDARVPRLRELTEGNLPGLYMRVVIVVPLWYSLEIGYTLYIERYGESEL